MKTFEVTLANSAGGVTIRLCSSTYQEAIKTACNVERAPESAVKTWRVVPTARQIARTKSLLRSI